MLVRSHWLAESGNQGKPCSTHVRVHSISTHAPANPSTMARRVNVGRPIIRGRAHHAAKYHTPTQIPTTGPSRNSPIHVTLCNHPNRIVHATACAAAIVHAY